MLIVESASFEDIMKDARAGDAQVLTCNAHPFCADAERIFSSAHRGGYVLEPNGGPFSLAVMFKRPDDDERVLVTQTEVDSIICQLRPNYHSVVLGKGPFAGFFAVAHSSGMGIVEVVLGRPPALSKTYFQDMLDHNEIKGPDRSISMCSSGNLWLRGRVRGTSWRDLR